MRRLILVALLVCIPATASAVRRESPYKRIKNAVTGKMYEVDSSHVIGINLGAGFGQEYTRELQFGLSYRYHPSNYLGVGISFLYALPFETAIIDEIRAVRPESLNQVRPEAQQGAATVDLHMVPIYGKFVLFGRYAAHYDLSFTLGLGVALVTHKLLDGQTGVNDMGTRGAFTTSVGVSLRILISGAVGIHAEFRDYIWQQKNPLTAESEWANHLSITLGPVFKF